MVRWVSWSSSAGHSLRPPLSRPTDKWLRSPCADWHTDVLLLDQCIRPSGVVKSPADDLGGPFVLLICRRVRCAGDHRARALASLSNTSELVLAVVSAGCYLWPSLFDAPKNSIHSVSTFPQNRRLSVRKQGTKCRILVNISAAES